MRRVAGELLLIKAFLKSLSSIHELIHSLFILCLHINHIPPQHTHPSLSAQALFVVYKRRDYSKEYL